MKGINWTKKLTSRKFWLSIANFVTMMIVACGGTEIEASLVAALIIQGGSVLAYVIGEGLADAAGAAPSIDGPEVLPAIGVDATEE